MSDEIKIFLLNIFLSMKKSKAPCGRPPINRIVENMKILNLGSLEKSCSNTINAKESKR